MNASRTGRSIPIEGVTHGQVPIPMGARVGNLIYSSALLGKDPATDTLPPEAADQARFLFANLRSFLANAGAGLEHVVHVAVHLRDNSLRELLNAEWSAAFPDPEDRPARHTHLNPGMHPSVLMQLEIVAVVGKVP